MAEIRLSKKQQLTFLIPEEEGDGVRKIAQKVAKTWKKPQDCILLWHFQEGIWNRQ